MYSSLRKKRNKQNKSFFLCKISKKNWSFEEYIVINQHFLFDFFSRHWLLFDRIAKLFPQKTFLTSFVIQVYVTEFVFTKWFLLHTPIIKTTNILLFKSQIFWKRRHFYKSVKKKNFCNFIVIILYLYRTKICICILMRVLY